MGYARTCFYCGAALTLLVLLPRTACCESSPGIRAITNPSADIILSFIQPGRIAKVSLKEGDSVEAGQLLIQLDDAVEQAQLAQLKAQSENTAQVQAAEASLEQKRIDLEKLKKAAEHRAATELEVQHATLDVKIAELSLEVARFEHEQDQRKYNEAQISVENMRLKSPISGKIEKVDVEVGECVNALADVVRVVKIDPLWVDVPVPLATARELKQGKTAKVKFPGTGTATVDGHITFVGAVADAASDTLRVRIEVPNQANRPAGEHVNVLFAF
jgi:RND family efflux transporter MFP subunit